VANRRQKKARQRRARQHGRKAADSRVARPSISDAQEERLREKAGRLREVGGRFGELWAKMLILPPSAPTRGEPLLPSSAALTNEEREELQSLAPQTRADARARGMQLVTDLRALIGRLEPFALLAVASVMNIWGHEGEYFEPVARGSEVQLELLAGLVATTLGDDDRVCDDEHFQEALDKAGMVIDVMELGFAAEAVELSGLDPSAALLRFQSLVRRLHVRGESYVQHAEALAQEVFGRYEDILRRYLGFSAQDLISVFRGANELVEEQVNAARQAYATHLTDIMDRTLAAEPARQEALGREMAAIVEGLAPNLGKALSFDSGRLSQRHPEFTVELVDAVLGKLSLKTGGAAENQYTWPLDTNPLSAKPFLVDKEAYAVPVPGFVARKYTHLMSSLALEYQVPLPQKYRADACEEIALDMLGLALGGISIYRSLYYVVDGERCETDGLALIEGVAIIVEAKDRPFSIQAQRGDTARLGADLGDSVLEATDQGLRVAQLLLSGAEVQFEDEDGAVVLEVPAGRVREAFVINPNLTSILELGARLDLLSTAGATVPSSVLPIFINDLRVIADLVRNPAEFVHYLRWRSRLPLERMILFDEGDLFGAYLLGEDFRVLHEHREVLLTGYYTTQFDDYYMPQERGKKAEPPGKTLPEGIRRYVDLECASRRPGWLERAVAALDLSQEAMALIDVRSNEIARQADRENAVFMNTFADCALVGMPRDASWTAALASVESSISGGVSHAVFVNRDNQAAHVRHVLSLDRGS
jgi:hypothetical protein